jgi:hypothetical protein
LTELTSLLDNHLYSQGAHNYIWDEVTSIYNFLYVAALFVFSNYIKKFAELKLETSNKKDQSKQAIAYYFSIRLAKVTSIIAYIYVAHIILKTIYVALNIGMNSNYLYSYPVN